MKLPPPHFPKCEILAKKITKQGGVVSNLGEQKERMYEREFKSLTTRQNLLNTFRVSQYFTITTIVTNLSWIDDGSAVLHLILGGHVELFVFTVIYRPHKRQKEPSVASSQIFRHVLRMPGKET